MKSKPVICRGSDRGREHIKQLRVRIRDTLTVDAAIERYITDRENVLSPSTIRGYRMIQRHRFQSVLQRPIREISACEWQKLVNQEAKRCAPKTLHNAWLFLSSVIAASTGERVSVRLPQIIQEDLPYLNAEQLPIFLNAIRGKKCEIPALLALSSLRRSELCNIRWTDIDLEAGCIRVHGAAVIDEHGRVVHKRENKNATSRRTIPFVLPKLREAVLAAEKTGEYVVTKHPNTVYSQINAVCRRACLPEVGVHGLRRAYASLSYQLGIPELITAKAGGWKDLTTMRKIYTQISSKEMKRQGECFAAFFK